MNGMTGKGSFRRACRVPVAVVLAMLAPGMAGTVGAADPAWPVKPIRMVVGFAAGGANDLVGRAIATKLGPRLGQQVVVDNRPGAGGNIATELVVRAPADGHTMLLGSVSSLAMGPALAKSVPYDPMRDLAPVAQAVQAATLLAVHPSIPVRTLRDMVALAKRKPGSIDIAIPGTGSIAHLAAEVFKKTAGIDLVLIPYKGGAPALTDVLAGQVGSIMSVISTPAPHVQSGRLRGLAVTSGRRARALPDVPTIAESGYPGYEVNGWLGVLFPAGTPDAIVLRAHREIAAIMALPDVRERMEQVGMDVDVSATPAAFAALVRSEVTRWAKIVNDIGLKGTGGN